jgi:hypothetical protein
MPRWAKMPHGCIKTFGCSPIKDMVDQSNQMGRVIGNNIIDPIDRPEYGTI